MSVIKSALLGVAIGDALGVPVEFLSRERMKRFPVTTMQEFGTHHQRAGTFSDDSSLTFCLAEALTNGFDIQEIADNFTFWCYEGFWSARGQVFDIGIATRAAIERIARGMQPELAGGFEISSNGNGSLMRILPLVFYIKDLPIENRYTITKQVSSITHGHIRSVISCFYYLEFARHLLRTNDLTYIYSLLQIDMANFLKDKEINPHEIALFDRLLKQDIYKFSEDDIQSSGYVLHTLEASIWCLMNTDNYRDAVLKAVNLGEDTDTTGAVTGGLAGLLYVYNNIPSEWLDVLARREDIENLADRLEKGLSLSRSDFFAKLQYKPIAEGWRKNPLNSGNWQLMKFAFEDHLFSGRQTFVDKAFVIGGDTIDAAINILVEDYFNGKLSEGDEFDFYDGTKYNGKGIITKIVNEKLRK